MQTKTEGFETTGNYGMGALTRETLGQCRSWFEELC
jgi:hypothetical protein